MTKSLLKKLFYTLTAPFSSASGASILMYHSVGENEAFFTVPPATFEWQLQLLKHSGRRVIFLSELVRLLRAGKDVSGFVALTFDDGYRDNLETALPLLERYELPATFFITTGTLGEERTTSDGARVATMSREQVKELSRHQFVEVAPHSVTHPHLGELPFVEAGTEIESSRQQLFAIAGECVPIFAFPSGRYTNELAAYLKEGPWNAAVTVHPGLVRSGDDPFLLPRNMVHAKTGAAEFKGLLTNAPEWYEKIKTYV